MLTPRHFDHSNGPLRYTNETNTGSAPSCNAPVPEAEDPAW
jgi:hypothetical protein